MVLTRRIYHRSDKSLGEAMDIVLEGAGSIEIGGKSFDWEQNDIFVVPNFLWRHHRNRGNADAVLYLCSNMPLLEKISQYRAPRSRAQWQTNPPGHVRSKGSPISPPGRPKAAESAKYEITA